MSNLSCNVVYYTYIRFFIREHKQCYDSTFLLYIFIWSEFDLILSQSEFVSHPLFPPLSGLSLKCQSQFCSTVVVVGTTSSRDSQKSRREKSSELCLCVGMRIGVESPHIPLFCWRGWFIPQNGNWTFLCHELNIASSSSSSYSSALRCPNTILVSLIWRREREEMNRTVQLGLFSLLLISCAADAATKKSPPSFLPCLLRDQLFSAHLSATTRVPTDMQLSL